MKRQEHFLHNDIFIPKYFLKMSSFFYLQIHIMSVVLFNEKYLLNCEQIVSFFNKKKWAGPQGPNAGTSSRRSPGTPRPSAHMSSVPCASPRTPLRSHPHGLEGIKTQRGFGIIEFFKVKQTNFLGERTSNSFYLLIEIIVDIWLLNKQIWVFPILFFGHPPEKSSSAFVILIFA